MFSKFFVFLAVVFWGEFYNTKNGYFGPVNNYSTKKKSKTRGKTIIDSYCQEKMFLEVFGVSAYLQRKFWQK